MFVCTDWKNFFLSLFVRLCVSVPVIAGQLGASPAVPSDELPAVSTPAAAAASPDDDEEIEEMKKRLEALKS
jgi:hypothetical protein